MAQKRISFKIGKVDFGLDFEDVDDLSKQLDEIASITLKISEKLGEKIVSPNQVRDDLQDIFSNDGKNLIFKLAPREKIDKAILAVYAYGRASLDDLAFTIGVKNPSSRVINASTNGKYFQKNEDESYSLSDLGLDNVTRDILPKLRKTIAIQEDVTTVPQDTDKN